MPFRPAFYTCVLATGTLLCSCVGATTQLAPLPPGAVEAEKERQRELALLEVERQQARLDSVAYPILAGATELCPSAQGSRFGLRISTIHNYPDDHRTAARTALDLSDTVSVLSVEKGSPAAKAGLLPGDRILRIGDRELRPGAKALEGAVEAFDAVKESGQSSTAVEYKRNGRISQTSMVGNQVCSYGTIVLNGGELNAFADGSNIMITSNMMRFASDEELSVIVAHEFAHNAMDHMGARKKNALFGALLGALGDLVLASRGIRTGGYYTAEGAKSGARAFSQDFEREADYVGLYALALSGHPLEGAPRFWRHMATANPKSIELAFTHPTTAERFVRMEQAIAEIEEKRGTGIALSPNMKGSRDDRPEPSPALAHGSQSRYKGAPPAGEVPSETINSSRGINAQPPDSSSDRHKSWGAEPTLVASVQREGRSSELRSISEARLQYILQDLHRAGHLEHYEEASRGTLVLVLGGGSGSNPSLEHSLKRLHSAYAMHLHEETPAVLELWLKGEKIGEYTSQGLVIGPSPSYDQPVIAAKPTTPGTQQLGIPAGTNWVTDRRSRVYYPAACSVVETIPENDRLYYMNESAPMAAGFSRGKGC